jgi:hypothetical protein
VKPGPRVPKQATRPSRGRFLGSATLLGGVLTFAVMVLGAPSAGSPAEPLPGYGAPERCRKAPLLQPVRVDAPYVYLDALPTGDTLLVSATNVAHPFREGVFVPPADLPDSVYGQTLVLLGSATSSAHERGMDTGDTVVVVWWGYDSLCEPRPFRGSALHLDYDDVSSLVIGTLRDPADWHEGRAVVDVNNPGGQPFPGRARVPAGAVAVSATHLLELYRALPERSAFWSYGVRSEEERQVFRDWANSSPEIGNAFPVPDWLRHFTPDR